MRRIFPQSFSDVLREYVVKEIIRCLTFGFGNEQTFSNCNIFKETNEELSSVAVVNFCYTQNTWKCCAVMM